MSAGTVQAALTDGIRHLTQAGIPGAPRDARLLMAAALGADPGRLTLHMPDPLSAEAATRFAAHIAARAAHTPVSHLTGRRTFHGRDFIVTPDVLDPRPETETLINVALSAPFSTLLDLGTGSGAILLTLMAERPGTEGQGTDLSDAALSVARRNADAFGVSPVLTRADWWHGVAGCFDLVISNPPYIAADEMADLSAEVLHEPHMALTDGADGLTAYRSIAAGALAHMAPQGRLIVEIGATQGPAVARIFDEAGLTDIAIHPDLDGRDRVVLGHRSG